MDDACSLATMAALSFDAEQANKAEWYASYPKVRRSATPSKQAVQRAEALPKPPPRRPPLSESAGKGALKHLDAREFSAFAGVTCGAVGSGRAAMSMIADIARREIEWQLEIMQPSRVHAHHIGLAIAAANSAADSAQRRSSRRKSGSRVSVRTGALSSVLVAAEDDGDGDGAGVPAAHGQRGGHMAGKKRKRGTANDDVAAEAPDSPCYPPEKKAKRSPVTRNHQHLHHRDRGAGAAAASSGTSGVINSNVPLERSLTPPAGPAAAFLYSLGARQGTTLHRARMRTVNAGSREAALR